MIYGLIELTPLDGRGDNPNICSDLADVASDAYGPTTPPWPNVYTPIAGAHRAAAGRSSVVQGVLLDSFFDDFYERIYSDPKLIDVGNLVTEQVRTITVWNAFLNPVTLLDDSINAGGIDVVAPGAMPLVFRPLQELVWELNIGTDGPPVIDAVLTFEFQGLYGVSVMITGRRLQAWPVPADWGSDLTETLSWLTEIQQSHDGNEDRQPLREAPRRTWEFDLVEGKRERRIIENAVYDWAGRVWAMPVMTDVELLANPLAAGVTVIPLATAGLDYRPQGLAILWADARQYELIEIQSITSTELRLARPTLQAWPRGARIYPCRAARLTEAPQWRRKSDQVITARVQFEAAEVCDWAPVAPPALYRGLPVLEQRGDYGMEPVVSTARQLHVIDGDIGLVSVEDFTNLAWASQSHAWVLHGRTERAAHRSLLYWLQGRYRDFWLPTWTDDVELVEPVLPAATVLYVAWAGITNHLRQQPGRRHLRIELTDGTVLYREVLDSVEETGDREALVLDAALGVGVTPQQVRLICWMAVSRLSADRVEIAHVTDSHGVAKCQATFTSTGGDEP